jgi:hypothetical protein
MSCTTEYLGHSSFLNPIPQKLCCNFRPGSPGGAEISWDFNLPADATVSNSFMGLLPIHFGQFDSELTFLKIHKKI